MPQDPIWLETEYNNRAKVPAHPAIFAAWARDARAFRESWPHAERDIAYGETERQAMDIFWPDTGRIAPVALFIHGGYWQAMDRFQSSHLAAGLLARGVAVAMPGYDLCPTVPLRSIVAQMRRAVSVLHARHPGPMLATGHSAGGHLAAMLLCDDPTGALCGAVSISGLFDLPPLIPTSLNVALRLDEAEARALSPLYLRAPAKPIHAFVGAEEGAEYTRQSSAISQAWGGFWATLTGHNHFSAVDTLADPHSEVVQAAVALLVSKRK